MKFLQTILTCISLFVFVQINAQYQITLKNGNSVSGNIEFENAGVFDKEVWLEDNRNIVVYKIKEIEKIEKGTLLFKQFAGQNETFFFNKKNVMLQQIVDGNIKLWAYKFSYTYQQKQNSEKITAVRSIFYIQNQQGELLRLDQNDYLQKLKLTLKGNKKVNEILQNRGYAYKQVPDIIKYYNKLQG